MCRIVSRMQDARRASVLHIFRDPADRSRTGLDISG